MSKELKNITVKLVIYIITCIVVSIIVKAFAPTLSNEVAIQQLNGGDYEFAQQSIYNSVKYYLSYGYIIFALALFSTNIYRVVKKITKNK